MKKLLSVFTFTFFLCVKFFTSTAQADSCNLAISLLTCSPGEELYSIFGHSALRVKDPTQGFDIIYNYGTFDFNDRDFYVKFVRGKLLYFVSVENYNDFAYSYEQEKRSIAEQLLNLNCTEKQRLFSALQVNAREENKYYKYDFLFDNCTTRLRDIVARNAQQQVQFKRILPSPSPTFRNLIHSYLNNSGQKWSRLGIDILLGTRLDVPLKNEEAMFLPDYLLKGFDSALVANKPLVIKKEAILSSSVGKKIKASSPFLFFSILLLLIAALTYFKPSWSWTALSIFDSIFFFIIGVIGLLILFMWFGTDHAVCRNNFNLLWALPTHIVMAFLKNNHEKWVKKYFQIVFALAAILLLTWIVLPQELNPAVLPILGLILLRSWQLGKKRRYGR